MNKNLKMFTSLQGIESYANEKGLALIVFKDGVYDMTEFQYKHPGGKAAITVYKNKVTDKLILNKNFHKNLKQTLKKLETYRMGHYQPQEFSFEQEKVKSNNFSGNST